MNTRFIQYRSVKANFERRPLELSDLGSFKYINADVIAGFEILRGLNGGLILKIQSRDQATIYSDSFIFLTEDTFERLVGKYEDIEDDGEAKE